MNGGSIWAALGLLVSATFLFSVLDTATKFVTAMGVPVIMVLWVRCLCQAGSMIPLALRQRGRASLATQHPWIHVLRGLLMAGSNVLATMSLRVLPLAEFTAIAMLTPLLVTLMAALLLKERVSVLRWLCVLGGFAGTLLIARPSGNGIGWNILLPLGMVVIGAGFQTLTSLMARTESATTMHLYTGISAGVAATAVLPLFWQSGVAWSLWAIMLLGGLCASAGHFLFILAFGRAPAATLMPYMYGQVAFSLGWGWLVFSQLPDRLSATGIGVIVVAGICGAWLSSHEARSRARERLAAGLGTVV